MGHAAVVLALPSSLEVKIAAYGEQPLKPLFHDFERCAIGEATIGGGHPAIGEVAVMWKHDPQRFMNAEQMPASREQIGVCLRAVRRGDSAPWSRASRAKDPAGRPDRRRQAPSVRTAAPPSLQVARGLPDCEGRAAALVQEPRSFIPQRRTNWYGGSHKPAIGSRASTGPRRRMPRPHVEGSSEQVLVQSF
jgi:hypothetical protein